MYQITKSLVPGKLIEQEHYVLKLRQWLPADGAGRKYDLVQFTARQGGIRTVSARDLTLM